MPYSIVGLIILQSEACVCVKHKWPCATLGCGISLIPLDRDFLLLVEGDETQPQDDVQLALPEWLDDLASSFSRSAYIEAEFFGGIGMQASVVMERGTAIEDPVISSGAINYALLKTGVAQENSNTFLGMSVTLGKDLFDKVNLGRHRSVASWLQEIDEAKNSKNAC